MAGTHWKRDEPQWYNVFELPWGTVAGPRLAAGVEGRLISRDDASDGSSSLLRVPAGWRCVEPADEGTAELFVLEGDLALDGRRVGPGGFVAVPRGVGTVELSSERGAQFLLYWNPRLPVEHYYDGNVQVAQTQHQDWLPYEVPGLRHGIMYKPLRFPDVATGPLHGGPGGMLRLHLLTPGLESPDEEFHHDCWEELLFLSGDFLMPKRGYGGAGTLLNNPADYEHGPYVTQRGSVLLTHTVAPMPTEYRSKPALCAVTAHYLDTTPVVDLPCTEQWVDRPERELLDRLEREGA